MVNFNPTAPAADTTGASTASKPSGSNAAVGKDAFLQLLVAQIRNQNPLNPADGVEFLSQLAQFSQLEQTMSMREDMSALRTHAETVANALTPPDAETETSPTGGPNN